MKMNKKAQFFDMRIISAIVAMILVIFVGIPILQNVFSAFQQPVLKIEDIILPLIILAIIYELIRRFVR